MRPCAKSRARLSTFIHIGSLAIKTSPDKAANRSFLIDRKGDIAARYDKIHMFDVDLAGGESYRESNNYRAGDLAVIGDLPWGRLGLTVCYDLRFPALYRALAEAGASFLAIPSAFTKQTGEAHWHVLMRARAIENGCFVFAAAQGGRHENGRDTFGHSLIVDPWGRILAEGGIEPGVVMAEVDPAAVAAARGRFRRCATAGASNWSSRWPNRLTCTPCGSRHDPLRAQLRPGPRVRELVSEFRRLRQAGETFARDLPGLRLGQDRKGDHGAAGVGKRRRWRNRRTAIAGTTARSCAASAFIASQSTGRRQTPVAMISPPEQELRQKLKEIRDHITKNANYVGTRFPEEARKIHYGETEHRSIYGEASPDEAKELFEEGIEFHPLPILPDDQN